MSIEQLENEFRDLFRDVIEGTTQSDNILTFSISDEKIEAELIDEIEYRGENYFVYVPIIDDDTPPETLILSVIEEDDGEKSFFMPKDEVLSEVFEIFKERNKDIYDFVD